MGCGSWYVYLSVVEDVAQVVVGIGLTVGSAAGDSNVATTPITNEQK
jgi:hypothetical protein